jgi:hypothetical protein
VNDKVELDVRHDFVKGQPVPIFEAPSRPVDRIFIHCTASDAEVVGDRLVALVEEWHKARKFTEIGYHVLIDMIGNVLAGRSLENAPAAQQGHNMGSIAICVHGLKSFSPVSLQELRLYCEQINDAYRGKVTFHGHREVSNKSCPVFDYKQVLGLDRYGRLTAK